MEFDSLLKGSFAQIASPTPARLGAWELFERLGLPDQRSERYRQIPLRELSGFTSAPAELGAESVQPLPETEGSFLLFLNGRFRPDLSALPEGVVVATLSEAQLKYSSFCKGRAAQWVKEEVDPFAALNGALYTEGAFLYLPPKKVVSQPVQLLFLQSGEGSWSMPRIQLFLGAGSSLRLVSTLAGSAPAWINRFIDCSLEEGARLDLTSEGVGAPKSYLFDALRAQLKRGSWLRSVGLVSGVGALRREDRIALTGEGAEVELIGGSILDESEILHTQILVDHQAPHCRSRQLFKGVLGGSSRSTFDGKIVVQPIAQQTDAFQLNNNLLLSDSALAHSRPNLEVFADDVKASHGATVGQLDLELLHYLRSRGIDSELARKMLVSGFVRQVSDLIPFNSIRNRFEDRL